MFTDLFEFALDHAMLYEVGGFWQLTPEVEAGLIETREQRRAVGYVDDPLDAGGETKYGVAKNGNPDLDITSLDWTGAKDVYFRKYWLAGSCDKLPPRIAVLHFDCCVNHGITRAGKFLQEAVGVDVDGVIGDETLAAVEEQDPMAICNFICDIRSDFFNGIVQRKPNQKRFLNGWLRRCEEMREFSCNAEI